MNAEFADAAEVLRTEIPSLADEIIDAIRDEVDAYRRPLSGTFGRNVRMGVEVALSRFLDGADERGRRAYVELGRGEFREGRSLESLLAAYRVGARVAWRRAHLAGEAAGVEPHALYALGEALFAYIDAISAESAEGWADAQSDAAGERQRARRRLVSLLAASPAPDEPAVRGAAHAAGWSLPSELAALAATPLSGEGPEPGQLATRLGADVIAATLDGVAVALVPDPAAPGRRRQVERALADHAVAIGPPVPWPEAARSIARARLAHRLAVAGTIPRDGLVDATEHLAALVLHADPALAGELAARELAPLLVLSPIPRGKLLPTLRAWLDLRGRVEEVAHAIDVHPQTVRYRLGQLRDLFGDRLEDPDGRLALALALRASPADDLPDR